MDIRSNCGYPGSYLSNFAFNPFVFDGVKVASMEGLLQAFKFYDQNVQIEVCKLQGYAAKKRGKNQRWQSNQILFWQGQEYKRDSQEYQDLLDRAYQAMFEQCPVFRKALKETGDTVIEHSIGGVDSKETILTQQEFCSRLTSLREKLFTK
jgi:hypothetical protein